MADPKGYEHEGGEAAKEKGAGIGRWGREGICCREESARLLVPPCTRFQLGQGERLRVCCATVHTTARRCHHPPPLLCPLPCHHFRYRWLTPSKGHGDEGGEAAKEKGAGVMVRGWEGGVGTGVSGGQATWPPSIPACLSTAGVPLLHTRAG